MPDNSSDGLLEDLIKGAIIEDEHVLFNTAEHCVQSLKTPKFKVIHRSKAEVATWMAWQKTPGQPLVGAVGGNLLDFQSGTGKFFIDWLKRVYLP